MCGIAGFLSVDSGTGTEAERSSILRRMGHAIAHRGPDDDGVWQDTEAGIGFVHRRLSIVDLSPAGHQPMASSGGRYVIVTCTRVPPCASSNVTRPSCSML